MRVLLQRVLEARVDVEEKTIGAIGPGLLLFVGIGPADGEAELLWMAHKIASLRIFPDAQGRMNRSITDIGGEALIVSQFTLYGDLRKGNRPSFVAAADPGDARRAVEQFTAMMAERVRRVATGEFGADMKVSLVNDGPVTLWLEREPAREG
ncbi:MAG: D-tyrosyl-tRNA(Tyr) deacylase [Myxococcales bacterium]|nr:D-tyrosyl-tRNA(Tyr) deacylase [Myxococcales bacterium]